MIKTAILRAVPGSGPLLIVVGLVWLSCATNISAGEPKTADAAGIEFFEKKVRPVLVQHCYKCHSHAGGKMRGGLALDSRSGWEKGGDSGPVIIPGNPGKSLLIQAVRHAQPDLKMPKEKLGEAEIAVLTEWVQKGAADPRVLAKKIDAAEWWSLKPLVKPQIPAKSFEHPIDAFIQAKLREKQLTPAPETDRRTLIRRLTFDLHGLPPTPEEVEVFVASKDAQAYEKLVDRLLASPRYGERWARHWLDVVRYGDSRGNEHDGFREHAWRYRDYVIDAFNRDKPYDRFIQEQIAADALYPEEPALTAALGFLAAGPDVLSGTEDTIRDEFVTTAMTAFTSTTAHCAHCHNHKFDPISQDDYYALQAIFAGVKRRDAAFDFDPAVRAARIKWTNLKAEANTKGKAAKGKETKDLLTAENKALVASREKALAQKKLPTLVSEALAIPAAQRSENAWLTLAAHILPIACDEELKKLPPPTTFHVVAGTLPHEGNPASAKQVTFLKRGIKGKSQVAAIPGSLSCVSDLNARLEPAQAKEETARRAYLARWLSDRKNPLTWRSIVNRVWHYHFGKGIVDTVNDFGQMGTQPTHPDLLDWLACEFRDNGMSFKKLHRLMVTSATYRQAVVANAAAEKIDVDNRLLWRMNRNRLDAESFRDSVLAVSGRLDVTMGGPGVLQFEVKPGFNTTKLANYNAVNWDAPGVARRSVYRFIFRTRPDPFMSAMDFPDASQFVPTRVFSASPLQALVLFNSNFVLHHSDHLARRIASQEKEPIAQVRQAFRLALQRDPTADESTDFTSYTTRHGLAAMCRVLLNSNEFLFVE